jgi:RNA polymerase sigma-70 factor, ECF subfamily
MLWWAAKGDPTAGGAESTRTDAPNNPAVTSPWRVLAGTPPAARPPCEPEHQYASQGWRCGMMALVANGPDSGRAFTRLPHRRPAISTRRILASEFRVTESPASTSRTILERVASGDQSAVAECLDQYGDLVWSLARRFMRNPSDAEDAVQDIFIDLWNSAHRYDRNIASELAFISTIARRRLIDRIRQIERRPAMDSLDDDEDESRTPIQPAVAATDEQETEVAIVERVLGKMEPEHQRILAMSLYEGYSHSEIAERLTLPLGTVKTRVRRGLIHIREQLRIVAASDSGDEGERGPGRG